MAAGAIAGAVGTAISTVGGIISNSQLLKAQRFRDRLDYSRGNDDNERLILYGAAAVLIVGLVLALVIKKVKK